MSVRPGTPADAAPIAELEALLFGIDAWPLDAVAGELAAADRSAFVAEDADAVCGYAVTMRAGDTVDLQRIGVHPSWQRRGVARTLLGCGLDRARADGAERMLLEVSAGNRAALSFYAEAGFVEIDRRRRYYRDGSDAVVLRLPLLRGCGGGAGRG